MTPGSVYYVKHGSWESGVFIVISVCDTKSTTIVSALFSFLSGCEIDEVSLDWIRVFAEKMT
jgi:hypothetical protein